MRKQRMEYLNKIAPVSLMVETSPGKFHCYWFTRGMDLERFTPLQKEFAAVLGSDPSINDLPRIMRVPGFVHRKGAPFLSRIHYVAESIGRRRQADYVSPDVLEQAIVKVRKKFGLWDEPKPSREPQPEPDLFDRATAGQDERSYALAALANAADTVAHAPVGTRNAALNTEAFSMYRLVETGALTREEVEEGLKTGCADRGARSPRDQAHSEIPHLPRAAENLKQKAGTDTTHAAANEPAIVTVAALESRRFPPIKYIVKGYLVEGLTILAGRPKIRQELACTRLGTGRR